MLYNKIVPIAIIMDFHKSQSSAKTTIDLGSKNTSSNPINGFL